MKRQAFSLLLAVLLTSLIPSTGFAASRELPNSIEKAVGKLEAHETNAFDEESLITYGSATFIDHGGCFFTNSHVVLNLSGEEHSLRPYFLLKLATDRGVEPQDAYEAEILFVDEEVDLAYGCPKDPDARIFTNFLPRFKQDQFYNRSYGEEVWLGGYPQEGQQTITLSPGHIVGFMEKPDISEFGGIPGVNQDRLRFYKSDALSAPGISGGIAFSSDFELVGIPFAGSYNAGGFVFLIGEKMYIEFEKDVNAYLIEEGLVPADCVYDWETSYYISGGIQYYDAQCSYPIDELLEQELKQTYSILCSEDIDGRRLVPAARRIKELGDSSQWTELVLDMCKGAGATTVGDFAYGKDRLSSLAEEQNLARELKAEIDAQYPQLKIHADDWSTIVNSYVYGGYPVEAINKAIELGGVTVHPSIPFETWRNSEEYRTWM